MSKQKLQTKRFRPKFHIKKGDTVVVISGDHKGEQGEVISIDTKYGRAKVQGVNIVFKHRKTDKERGIEGEILEIEAPLNISKLMLVNPRTGTPSRIGRRQEGGKSVRFSKKTGEVIL